MDFDEKLQQMANELWELVKRGKDAIILQSKDIKFDDKKKQFCESYCKLYKEIQDTYMHKSEALDRHKVAAIMIICVVKIKPLSIQEQSKEFMGNYVLAADAGFNYMLDELNRVLKDNGMECIQRYAFPDALACDTYYYKIFYRNLYYTEKNESWSYNPLELADKLFLLEYITLKENNVDMKKLKK